MTFLRWASFAAFNMSLLLKAIAFVYFCNESGELVGQTIFCQNGDLTCVIIIGENVLSSG